MVCKCKVECQNVRHCGGAEPLADSGASGEPENDDNFWKLSREVRIGLPFGPLSYFRMRAGVSDKANQNGSFGQLRAALGSLILQSRVD